jgi:hypothetical protein
LPSYRVCLVSDIQMTSATSVSAPYYSPTLKLEKTGLKVARADQHLDHLRQRISLIEADVFSIVEERDPRSDDRVWRMVPGAKASNFPWMTESTTSTERAPGC